MARGVVQQPALGPQPGLFRLGWKTKTDWRQLLSSAYAIPGFVFVSYLLLNLGINGPAYLSDEIGYLDKAATLAGSTVHLSTSWFGGYSLMISPAFLLTSNPYAEWHIIMVLNALMWAASAALLQYILRHTQPQASARAIRLATLGAMLYPAWPSMSGYAFSTSGFVLVFMAALAAIIKSDLRHYGWLAVAGWFAGYLCWIHPLGSVFLGFLLSLLACQAILKRQWRFGLLAFGGLAFAMIYPVVVDPWFRHIMRGSVVNDSHYAYGLPNLLRAVTTLHYWSQVGELMVGLVFSVVVATFGLAVYGALPVIKELYSHKKSWLAATRDTRLMVMLLVMLSVVAVICLTALAWGTNKTLRIDQWVYGRYADMYLLPLIGFGLLASWRARQAILAAGFVLAAGIFINTIATPANTSFVFDNKVNIQGLWPMHVASVFHADHYWLWGLLGAAGVLSTAYMGTSRRKAWLVVLLIPVTLAMAGNYVYHRTLIRQHATVSPLYSYLKSHYTPDDCIGFTAAPDSNERFNLYSYYLHGYDIKKITLNQSQQQKCNGPYLTYQYSANPGVSYTIADQEKSTGLYVLTTTR